MSKYCPWCQDFRGNTDLDFGVIDDNFGQYVHIKQIKFCPFCGRELNKGDFKEMENGTNVVIVTHTEDWQNRSYIFSVPDGVTLRAGDDVLCQTKKGKAPATCFCDSFFLEKSPLEAVVKVCGGKLPLEPIIGRYEYKSFTEADDDR